jgi:PAS domain S-box-containing protein
MPKVVSELMSKEIVQVSPETTVREGIELMRQKKIGAILVEEGGITVGIFTERDLLTKIDLSDPAKLPTLQIREVMTRNLIVVDHQETPTHVLELMRSRQIRHAPVVKDGQVIGITSLRDLAIHYEESLKHYLQEQDATLKQTLEDQQALDERYRTVFNNSAVGITVIDRKEKIIDCNAFIADLLEMTKAELVGTPVQDLYLPEEWQRIRDLNIRQAGMRHHLETQMLNKRKQLIDVDISISILKDAQGHVMGSIGILRDIRQRKRVEAELEKHREHLEELVQQRTQEFVTANLQLRQEIAERKRVEEALQKAYEEVQKTQGQLIQAEKMQVVGGLASGVAHEVKNPLMIIQQGVAYLTRKCRSEDSDLQLALKHMNSAVQRADRIVRGLLDFARSSELNIAPTEINQVMEEALEFIKHHLVKGGVEVNRQLQSDLPLIDIDQNKMEQVFIDLILNSVAAMPAGGQITVRSFLQTLTSLGEGIGRRQDDAFRVGEQVVVVEIEDSGTGIPADIIGKIFDPFFTTKRTKGGTGLGLTVVKNIIDMHWGKLQIENRKDGKGAIAIIMLKLKVPVTPRVV